MFMYTFVNESSKTFCKLNLFRIIDYDIIRSIDLFNKGK